MRLGVGGCRGGWQTVWGIAGVLYTCGCCTGNVSGAPRFTRCGLCRVMTHLCSLMLVLAAAVVLRVLCLRKLLGHVHEKFDTAESHLHGTHPMVLTTCGCQQVGPAVGGGPAAICCSPRLKKNENTQRNRQRNAACLKAWRPRTLVCVLLCVQPRPAEPHCNRSVPGWLQSYHNIS